MNWNGKWNCFMSEAVSIMHVFLKLFQGHRAKKNTKCSATRSFVYFLHIFNVLLYFHSSKSSWAAVFFLFNAYSCQHCWSIKLSTIRNRHSPSSWFISSNFSLNWSYQKSVNTFSIKRSPQRWEWTFVPDYAWKFMWRIILNCIWIKMPSDAICKYSPFPPCRLTLVDIPSKSCLIRIKRAFEFQFIREKKPVETLARFRKKRLHQCSASFATP